MTQHEALTFPELLETVPNDAYLNTPEGEREARIIPVGRYCHNAAAELRRLHALVAAREDDIETHSAAVYEATRLLAQAREQMDALLEALRSLLSYANVLEMRLLDADGEHRAMQQARAAIARAEGETNGQA